MRDTNIVCVAAHAQGSPALYAPTRHMTSPIVATMASGMIVPMYGPSCEKPWTKAPPAQAPPPGYVYW